MSSEDFNEFKKKLNDIMIMVVAQVIFMAFAAGGAWIQLAQHEEWKKDAQPRLAILWQWFSSDNRFALNKSTEKPLN